MKVQGNVAIDYPRAGVVRISRCKGGADFLFAQAIAPLMLDEYDCTLRSVPSTQFLTAADCIRASMVLPQSRLNAKLKSPRPARTFRWSRTTSS